MQCNLAEPGYSFRSSETLQRANKPALDRLFGIDLFRLGSEVEPHVEFEEKSSSCPRLQARAWSAFDKKWSPVFRPNALKIIEPEHFVSKFGSNFFANALAQAAPS